MRADQLPIELRPREKAWLNEVESLNDEELLAIIIGKGVKGKNAIELSKEILYTFGGFSGLSNCSWRILSKIKGISKIKSLEIIAIMEIGKRLKSCAYGEKIDDCTDFSKFINEVVSTNQEVFVALSMNRESNLINRFAIKGNNRDISVLIDDILLHLTCSKARKCILIHNHLSGDFNPSQKDLDFTVKMNKISSTLGIKLVDHVIIGKNGQFSFRNHNLL